ncbi:type II toxin-antitoxin system PemK/MazF family toxin [Thiotrichales bacterium 19S11-10]|nr:type II toxin-antitoxin system PemK/MazF family toxin [Thiotrichales bacterium 19S11-10]
MYYQFDVWLVTLDPTIGSEIKKSRPCVIISPDELNTYLKTVIVAPLTSQSFSAPFRIDCMFNKTNARILLDQIRTVDKKRLKKLQGHLHPLTTEKISKTLVDMFQI